jgi:hypothetical protein
MGTILTGGPRDAALRDALCSACKSIRQADPGSKGTDRRHSAAILIGINDQDVDCCFDCFNEAVLGNEVHDIT